MAGLLVLSFLLLPFIELAVFLAVAGRLGLLVTVAVIVLVGVAGGLLIKRQGLGVWRRADQRLRAGEMPTAEVVNGLLILAAGLLLALPGFVSDLLAIALLLPPVRAALRAVLFRRFEQRVDASLTGPFQAAFGFGRRPRINAGPATYTVYEGREVIDPGRAGPTPPGRERP